MKATGNYYEQMFTISGKMASYFGKTLADAIDQGKIAINFKGVGIGDGWVGPLNCMYSYAPYLL